MKDRCFALCKYLVLIFTFSVLYACGGGSSGGGGSDATGDVVSSSDTPDTSSDDTDGVITPSESDSSDDEVAGSDDTPTDDASDSSDSSGDDVVVTPDTTGGDSSDDTTDGTDSGGSSEPERVTIVVSWDIPDARTDGGELLMSEISSYTIRYKFDDEAGYSYLEVNDPTADSSEVEVSLLAGTYEFAIMTTDTDGLNSEYSTPQTIELTI